MPAAEFDHLLEQIRELKEESRQLERENAAMKYAIIMILASACGESKELYSILDAEVKRYWPIELLRDGEAVKHAGFTNQ